MCLCTIICYYFVKCLFCAIITKKNPVSFLASQESVSRPCTKIIKVARGIFDHRRHYWAVFYIFLPVGGVVPNETKITS